MVIVHYPIFKLYMVFLILVRVTGCWLLAACLWSLVPGCCDWLAQKPVLLAAGCGGLQQIVDEWRTLSI
jgi:hypothetical protein